MATQNVGTLEALLRVKDTLSPALKQTQRRLSKFGGAAKQAFAVVGAASVAMGAAVAAVAGKSIQAAARFESSFTGIRKTVEATEEQFDELAAGMRRMALEVPVNVNELNRIGEAAGQLGIKVGDIEEFTRVMAQLGVTTNLASDEAATQLARLANITGMSSGDFGRLGATVVGLGNSFATTEAEIVTFGMRIAAAGSLAGLSEADILSIGAAMSSVGVQAEAGGTAVQKVLIKMTRAAEDGGADLQGFAAAAGVSAQQFAASFRDDAAGAFTLFVEGLGRSGIGAAKILDDLNLKDTRLAKSFLSLAGAGDVLRTAIDKGNTSWIENTALAKEAALRFGTTESQLKLVWAQVRDVGIALGGVLKPALDVAIAAFLELFQKAGSVEGGIQLLIDGFLLLFAGMGAVVRGAAILVRHFAETTSTSLVMTRSLVNAAKAMAEVAAAMAVGSVAQGITTAAVEKLTGVSDGLTRQIGKAQGVMRTAGAAQEFFTDTADDMTAAVKLSRGAVGAFVGPIQTATAATGEFSAAATAGAAAATALAATKPALLATKSVMAESGRTVAATGESATEATGGFNQLFQSVLVNRLEWGRLHRVSGGLTQRLAAARAGALETSASFTGFTTTIQTQTRQAGYLKTALNPPGGMFAAGSDMRAQLNATTDSLNKLAQVAGDGVFDTAFAGIDQLKGGFTAFKSASGLMGTISSLGSMASGIGALLPLASMAFNGIKKLFSLGGPSEAEKAGRAAADEFAGMTEEILTSSGALQVQELVSQGWSRDLAVQVVAVGEKYKELGLTQEDANRDVKAIWDAIKEGPEATRAAMAVVEGNLAKVGSAAQGVEADIDRMMKDRELNLDVNVDEVVTRREIVDVSLNTAAIEGLFGAALAQAEEPLEFRHGTGGAFMDFGAATPVILHGKERVVTESEGRTEAASIGVLAHKLDSIERLLRDQPRAQALAMSDAILLTR